MPKRKSKKKTNAAKQNAAYTENRGNHYANQYRNKILAQTFNRKRDAFKGFYIHEKHQWDREQCDEDPENPQKENCV